jgi:fatty-acyl-CoA synthase
VDESTVESAWSSRKAQDTALLLYTSGTTTDPKGCELTHEALVRSWSAYADPVGFEPDQSMWTPCPFFHVGGIGVTVSALVRGATMMSMNWFEPKVALAHIEKRQAEHLFPAFPPLTLGLLRAPGYDPGRLTFVRTILNVAPADTQRVIENLLPEQAVLLTDFGMTEGAGMITVTPRDAAGEDRLSRNGTPLPGIEVRVTNPQDPKTNQPNDVPGEIQFRGINAFRASYKVPRVIRFIADWPMSATKIQKFRLRELLLQCHQASVRAPNDVRCHPSGAWRELMAQSDLSGGSPNPFAREGTGLLCHGSVALQVCLIISAAERRVIARC